MMTPRTNRENLRLAFWSTFLGRWVVPRGCATFPQLPAWPQLHVSPWPACAPPTSFRASRNALVCAVRSIRPLGFLGIATVLNECLFRRDLSWREYQSAKWERLVCCPVIWPFWDLQAPLIVILACRALPDDLVPYKTNLRTGANNHELSKVFGGPRVRRDHGRAMDRGSSFVECWPMTEFSTDVAEGSWFHFLSLLLPSLLCSDSAMLVVVLDGVQEYCNSRWTFKRFWTF